MYKTRLQELCRQRQWAAPQYTTRREGPDHNPRFHASVAVDGRSFDAPDLSMSSREAQGKAAMAALGHLAGAARSPPLSSHQPVGGQASYMHQLVNLCHSCNLNDPVYEFIREGPVHVPLFKAVVTIEWQTYESPQFFNSLKEAKQDAARVALMTLSTIENQQVHEEPGFYKNLLQELAMKGKCPFPVYKTVRDGTSHIPMFSSTVEIEGESFIGATARTKKQAEMNVAKIAWCYLKEHKDKVTTTHPLIYKAEETDFTRAQSAVAMNLQQPRGPSFELLGTKTNEDTDNITHKDKRAATVHPLIRKADELETGPMISPSSVPMNFQQPKAPSIQLGMNTTEEADIITHKERRVTTVYPSICKPEDLETGFTRSQSAVTMNLQQPRDPSVQLLGIKTNEETDVITHKERITTIYPSISKPEDIETGFTTVDMNLQQRRDPSVQLLGNEEADVITDDRETNSSGEAVDNEQLTLVQCRTSSSSVLSSSNLHDDKANSEPNIDGNSCSLLSNKVRVFPRRPNLELPEGATLLPISDDKWVAVSLK